jgi:hypothetical protein
MKMPSRMRHNFTFAHMEHTMFIPQKGEVPPRCQVCGHTGRNADTASHRASMTCHDDQENYQRYLNQHIAEESSREVEGRKNKQGE